MEIAASLTLAAIHLCIWARQRRAWANLLFATIAISVAGIAAFEFLMMRAQTPSEFGVLGRWMHVPNFVACAAIVGFVRVYLGAGRSMHTSMCPINILRSSARHPVSIPTGYPLKGVALSASAARKKNPQTRTLPCISAITGFGLTTAICGPNAPSHS